MSHQQQFRRPKQSPCADFWHTMRIGIAVAVILFVVLPFII